jgi:hypothetical protein
VLLTVHHPIFVHHYTHVVLPQWLQEGIPDEYRASIKRYLEVHRGTEEAAEKTLKEFGRFVQVVLLMLILVLRFEENASVD